MVQGFEGGSGRALDATLDGSDQGTPESKSPEDYLGELDLRIIIEALKEALPKGVPETGLLRALKDVASRLEEGETVELRPHEESSCGAYAPKRLASEDLPVPEQLLPEDLPELPSEELPESLPEPGADTKEES